LSGGHGRSISRFVASTQSIRGGSTAPTPEDSPESSLEFPGNAGESITESVPAKEALPSPPAEETNLPPQINPTTPPQPVSHHNKVQSAM
jgi:hypothetical protein